MTDWSHAFDDPIAPPDGRQLVTLRHAAEYVQGLPVASHQRAEWQTAVRILIAAAEGQDFIMHARIAMMRAMGRGAR